MENVEFKKKFGELANENGFILSYGGWFKEYDDLIQVLELQKSNFGNYYYLNFKIFIQGIFGKIYIKNKTLVKSDMGDILVRQPSKYTHLLDLDYQMDDIERINKLREMFTDFIIPLSNHTTSKEGIKTLHYKGELFILGAVKDELGIPFE